MGSECWYQNALNRRPLFGVCSILRNEIGLNVVFINDVEWKFGNDNGIPIDSNGCFYRYIRDFDKKVNIMK